MASEVPADQRAPSHPVIGSGTGTRKRVRAAIHVAGTEYWDP